MKKILFLIFAIIPLVAIAETININWYVDDSVYSTSTCTVGGNVILPTPPTKYGYTFEGWTSYIRLEYIESTGTQYIDTGFKPNQDTKVIVEYSTGSMFSSGFIFGARQAVNVNGGFDVLYAGASGESFSTDYNNSRKTGCQTTSSPLYFGNKLKVDENKNVTVLYDAQGNSLCGPITHNYATFSLSYSLLLFGINSGGVMQTTSGVRIFSAKIYDNGTLIRDMVPVLDDNNVPCMYDKVESKLYYNAGTGEFVAGPEL